jgi:hypothetical protein
MVSRASASIRSGRALAIRLVVTGIAIGLWFWSQSLIGRRYLAFSGIGDALHSLSAPLNQYLVLHPAAANGLLIASSGVIDLLAIFIFAEWVFGRSVRPLLGLAILLGLRQLAQALCALPKPDDMIWHYPGFPSLLVTYSVSNDFFFSAHTAIAVFAATEIARFRRRWLTLLAVAVVVFEAAAVLVLRAHYTMDVFTAIIAALYAAYLADRISPSLDRALVKYLGPGRVRSGGAAHGRSQVAADRQKSRVSTSDSALLVPGKNNANDIRLLLPFSTFLHLLVCGSVWTGIVRVRAQTARCPEKVIVEGVRMRVIDARIALLSRRLQASHGTES